MPEREYRRRIDRWNETIASADRAHLLLANLRLAAFVGGAAVFWLAFIRSSISPWSILAPIVVFGALAVRHARVLETGERARRARRFYERGLDRIGDRWMGQGRGGAGYQTEHRYARDLDIFGRGSLFELLNGARTEVGEDALASWLLAPAGIDEVLARQAAVAELRPLLDLREDIAVLADEAAVGRTGLLVAWTASTPPTFPGALRWLFPLFAAVAVALAAGVYWEVISLGWFLAWVLVQSSLAAIWRKPIHRVLHEIETPEHDLALLSSLLERVERERFESPKLAALHQALLTDGIPPSRRIAQLRRLVSWLDSTHNLFFAPFAHVLLVRPQLALAISAWHRAYGPAVGAWLRGIGELEALASLATYGYEHPRDPFPAVSADVPHFHAVALAHPLLPDAVVVRNDVSIGGDSPHVLVVSGSNMSGKSTLLRAVGVNAVLALAGGPVRAASLTLSPLAIGATLTVQDSLQEGHSRFYTEILRIRSIVELTRAGKPVLFLLDEILQGTNSHDRRIGAEAIVRALVARGAIGLVTTHDLALTELTATLGPAANVHFEDRLEQGVMAFDYTMRPGIVERSNALELMRAIGLDV